MLKSALSTMPVSSASRVGDEVVNECDFDVVVQMHMPLLAELVGEFESMCPCRICRDDLMRVAVVSFRNSVEAYEFCTDVDYWEFCKPEVSQCLADAVRYALYVNSCDAEKDCGRVVW
ncbi:hypothetical protein STSP2_02163 [Anaerohalosphaera lusitana]|uniref:Uncharacterized protein n=1 Tax=Anaerohalosphaera lusitana TaxID=1936003 RepID=A0A1U9NMC5_9BACT|nr:hypothetical protein [Anaerohalosphaera lusitana]AQT68985.1 hypothetical protein STSP2_02163 [Anaerohalosphaera lusitana]